MKIIFYALYTPVQLVHVVIRDTQATKVLISHSTHQYVFGKNAPRVANALLMQEQAV